MRLQRCSLSTLRKGERLRVAIVGGGAAGLSAALHLAPLVTSGKLCGPIDVFEPNPTSGRDIGVGLWSTGLDPLRDSNVESHQLAYQDMIRSGSFINGFGYRTPKGHWLAETRLDDGLPKLLFLREKDLLVSLRKAVHLEEIRGNVVLHSSTRVHSVYEESTQPWSAPLVLHEGKESTKKSVRDYHLIVAADGMNSVLRKLYGGHLSASGSLAGTHPSPLDLTRSDSQAPDRWYVTGQAEATSSQDRQYTVFRGNAPLSGEEIGDRNSFQTWGEGQSMRFATVPMFYSAEGKKEERQVWFITINNDDIQNEPDPVKRRDKLLEQFGGWHDPVARLVAATPPEEILMERAMAHKHSMNPVSNFNAVVHRIRKNKPASSGNGPAIVFVGDAFMTVDPILAQGFTFAMEGAAGLHKSLGNTVDSKARPEFPDLAFDPYQLRADLRTRNEARISRLIHMLQATELVQALGQPTTGTISGLLSRDILRPLMRMTPGFIKTPIFNYLVRFSLGLPQTPAPPEQAGKEGTPSDAKPQNS